MSKQVSTGILFLLIGVAAIVLAKDLQFGTPRSMGPGFFPIVLGGMIVLLAITRLVGGLRLGGDGLRLRSIQMRPLVLIPAAVVSFSTLIRPAGLVASVVAVVLISCLAGKDFKVGESIVLSLVLTAIATAIFVYGLGIPLQLVPSP